MRIRTFVREKQSALHLKGTIQVPRDYPTIQAAIDAAEPGYRIEVFPGKYHEQLVMKEGLVLISHIGEDGNELVAGPGRFPVLKRAKRTILDGDGFPWGADAKPMVLFPHGTSSETILDGFTITGMPLISPSRPDHPHVLECGGASPIIRNNIIYNNGAAGLGSFAVFNNRNRPGASPNLQSDSPLEYDDGAAGLGSFAVFKDRAQPETILDLRFENVIWQSRPIISENVFYENLFGGIHANYYSQTLILKNEIFRNRSRGEFPGPGIGVQNGASPFIKENLVYENDWGGIGSRKGQTFGNFRVNLPTLPKIVGNEVYGNGRAGEKKHMSGIGLEGVGAAGREVLVENNLVYRNSASGISARKKSFVLIKNNHVTQNQNSGIGMEEASGWIIGNTSSNNSKSGIGIKKGEDLIIETNLVYDNYLSGIGIESVNNAMVTANQVRDNGVSGFWEMIRDLFGMTTGGIGIRVQKSRGIKILGNRVENNQKPGITITEKSTEIILEDNYVAGNGLADNPNISIIKGSQAVLSHNTLLNSARSNLAIEESVAIVRDNLIKNSFQPGVYLNKNPYVELTGNRISESGTSGISIHSTKGLITGNLIEKSQKYGIVYGRNANMNVKNNRITDSGLGKIAGFKSNRIGPDAK